MFLKAIWNEMCEESVNAYPSALVPVSNLLESSNMCKKAVDNCPFMLECVPNWYKTQEMC